MKLQKHHITPRCLLKHKDKSFIDDPRNIVMLPYEQHVKAHKWLAMLTNDDGCWLAYNIMTTGKFKFDRTGINHLKESKVKMSKSSKGKLHSDKTKLKLSILNSGSNNNCYRVHPWCYGLKRPDHSLLMKNKNPMKGKFGKDNPTSYIWTVKGIEFYSCKEAAIYFNVTYPTILRWCKSHDKPDCYSIKREDKWQQIPQQ